MKTFAENLKAERVLNKITQQGMADALNIPLKTYRSYESLGTLHRSPDLELVCRIADILKTSVDELLGRK